MFVHLNPKSIDHLAKHGVIQEEAEYVVMHAQPPYPEAVGEGKHAVWGKTAAGRFLQVIFVYRSVETINLKDVPPYRRLELQEVDEVAYIIHARDLTDEESRRWHRRRGTR